MTNENNVTPNEPVTPSPAQQVRSDWRALMEKMSYRAVVTNIPFLSFLALLCMLYISNNRRSIGLQREISRKTKTLEELHWKYWDAKSQLMQVKTETQVMKNAEAIGLRPSVLPAYKVTTK